MALVSCRECAAQISDSAKACPQCGAPVIHGRTLPCRQCGKAVEPMAKACPYCKIGSPGKRSSGGGGKAVLVGLGLLLGVAVLGTLSERRSPSMGARTSSSGIDAPRLAFAKTLEVSDDIVEAKWAQRESLWVTVHRGHRNDWQRVADLTCLSMRKTGVKDFVIVHYYDAAAMANGRMDELAKARCVR